MSQSDEGYVEQRFEIPDCMKEWTEEQKAEFAYQLLLSLPSPNTLGVVERILPLLRRDFISTLPDELALYFLQFLDAISLARLGCVSRRWKKLSEDPMLWRALFKEHDWNYDSDAIHAYLSNAPGPKPSTSKRSSELGIAPVPLVRSSTPLYDRLGSTQFPSDPHVLSSVSSNRLHRQNRPGDILLRLRLRRSSPSNEVHDQYVVSLGQDTPHTPTETSPHTPLCTPSGSQSTSIIPYVPMGTPSSASRSQPLIPSLPPIPSDYASRTSYSCSTSQPRGDQTMDADSSHRHLNRPSPRHVKYDETIEYHYSKDSDSRYINWKRLYHNRDLIEKRWRRGECKIRHFPPDRHLHSMHSEGIYCIQFDNEILVSGSRDRSIKIWSIKTGKCRRTLSGHSASVLCLQYDSKYIVSGSSDSTIIQWDILTGEILRVMRGHSESVLNLRFAGNRVVSGSRDRTVRVWDLDRGETIHILRGHDAAVNAVQFKGNRIVSASGDRMIRLWDMDTGQCIRKFDSHSRGIACVEFDGRYIVSGSSDTTIKVWDATTGECLHSLEAQNGLVRTLQMDSHLHRIVSGGYNGSLKIWSIYDNEVELFRYLPESIEGRILNLQFDYARIVCCTNYAKIMMFDYAHGIDTQFLL